MARIDSIYQYLASIPDKRTSVALAKVFERFIPRSTEPVAAGQYANLYNIANTIELTATRTVLASESGCTFLLNSATEFVTTLPTPAAGLRYTFIVKAAPASASYTVVTASSANLIKGFATNAAGAAVTPLGDGDTITFVDSQAVAGDQVTVISDGTSWFMSGFAQVAAGITNTKAS